MANPTSRLFGINTKQFQAHSYRGAGLSHALNKGVRICDILKASDWANVKRLKHHYEASSTSSPIGQMVLEGNMFSKYIYIFLINDIILVY